MVFEVRGQEMHVHILGIGGTFMGGVAQIAHSMGMRVTGQDRALYSPMREQLAACRLLFGI